MKREKNTRGDISIRGIIFILVVALLISGSLGTIGKLKTH